jgi:hypothetical protein
MDLIEKGENMKTTNISKTCNIIGVFLILCIWGGIIALHTGIIFNPWIYEKMLELEKEKGEEWNKYEMKAPTDFDNPLHIEKMEHNLIESLKSNEIARNCDACEYILQDWVPVSKESVPVIAPLLISFLSKDSNVLQMNAMRILTKYKIEATENVRPLLKSDNPFLRIAAKEYFHTMGENIDPKADKDYVDWDAKYDKMVLHNRIASVFIGIVLTILILGIQFVICRKINENRDENRDSHNPVRPDICSLTISHSVSVFRGLYRVERGLSMAISAQHKPRRLYEQTTALKA